MRNKARIQIYIWGDYDTRKDDRRDTIDVTMLLGSSTKPLLYILDHIVGLEHKTDIHPSLRRGNEWQGKPSKRRRRKKRSMKLLEIVKFDQ